MVFKRIVAAKKSKRALAGGLVAVAAVVALSVSALVAAAATSASITDVNYPNGTTAVADASTMDSYKTYPTNVQETSFDTTQFAGRLWTDKTVVVPDKVLNGNDYQTVDYVGTTATFNLADSTRNLDPSGQRTTPGELNVDKTAAGTFLTSVSALSSSLTTDLYEPVPLDIVLVLDVSGSMGENGTNPMYVPYTQMQLDALTPGYRFTSTTYFKNRTGGYTTKQSFEGYCYVSNSPNGDNKQLVPYINKYNDSAQTNVLYILTTDESLIGTTRNYYAQFVNPDSHVHTGENFELYEFGYTNLYTYRAHYKIDDLHVAASEFIGAIAENNQNIASEGFDTSFMSSIGIVKFSGQYTNGSFVTPVYQIGDTHKGRTEIMSPLTVYTTNGSSDTEAASGIRNRVESLVADGGTSADNALVLANGIFQGQAYYTNPQNPEPGARPGVQKVVVFFTDGNPKHDRGNAPHDFSGLIAQQTWEQAESLKNDGVTIYSVAIVDGADPSDINTMNVNIYLNGVSSNYLHASATDGVNNLGNNVYGSNTGVGVPADLEPRYYSPSDLSWNPALGDRNDAYTATSDTTLVANKTYYTRTGKGTVADPFVYTAVGEPAASDLSSYFEEINYYLAVDGDQSLTDAFMKILSQISSGGGEDATATGRDGNTAITITDYLGDYMEFKGLDGILYGTSADTTNFYAPGTQGAYHTQAQVQRDDASDTQSTYTMWAPVPSALLNPPEGQENVNLNLITVKVTRSTDPKTGDTVTITIPPELIPSLRYAVKQTKNTSGGEVETTTTRMLADPLRIFYSVGPKANTLTGVIGLLEDMALRSENASNEIDRQSEAYQSFMADAARDGQNGVYRLYSNDPAATPIAVGSEQTNGKATVDMTLSTTNPYYFYQEDEVVYIKNSDNQYVPATSDNYTTGAQLYVKHRVWTVGGGRDDAVYVEFSGTPTLNSSTNGYYIPAGTAKTAAGDYTNVVIPKTESGGGATETATTSLTSDFSGGTTAAQHLGNNGVLVIPVFGTLAVTKNVSAGGDFDLPTDPVPTFKFTLNLKDAGGTALTQENTYRALIRNAAGHPIDPDTHTPASSADSVKFYVTDGSTFELRDGETIKVTNLPHNATYTVTETGQPGYAATVTDNTGVSQEPAERGASASTLPAAGAGD